MVDRLGMSVQIGDTVIFTNGGQGDNELYFGLVDRLENRRGDDCVFIRKLPKKTLQQRPRYSDEIVLVIHNTDELRELYPERFI